jgi:uncharacterized membrane protein
MNGRRIAVASAVCAFAAGYAVLAILKHRHFNSSYDLAIYGQGLWHLSRFELPASSVRGMSNLLGDHFDPIVALLVPIVWLSPSVETLLAAQAVLLALSIVPVFLFARRRLAFGPAYAIAIAYGLFWGMQQTAIFDLHEAAFAPLGVALLLLAIDRRRWGWMWAAAIALAATKEDLTPFLAVVGGYLFAIGERRRGAALLVGSLAAFAVIVGVVIPAAADAGAYGYRENYSGAVHSPWRLPWMLVSPPIKMLTAFLWVAPFALLPLASPLIVLVAPLAAERFWSASRNHWGTIFHYTAPIAPIVAMAAADGLARIGARVEDAGRRRLTIAALSAACLLCSSLLPGHQPLWSLFAPKTYRFDAIDRTGREALLLIDADASVVAQACAAPHLPHRTALYRLDADAPDAEYVIAVDGRSPWPLATFAEIRLLLDERQRHGYAAIFDRDGWIVLRRPQHDRMR